jgi:hypothetical protein
VGGSFGGAGSVGVPSIIAPSASARVGRVPRSAEARKNLRSYNSGLLVQLSSVACSAFVDRSSSTAVVDRDTAEKLAQKADEALAAGERGACLELISTLYGLFDHQAAGLLPRCLGPDHL